MTVFEAVTAWIAYRDKLVALGLVAKSTADNQAAIGARIIDGLGDIDLSALRKSDIEIWIGTRLQICVPVTVRGELNVLRQILNWCVDEQLLVTKPRLPTLSVPSTESALPSDDAFLWVLANVPARHAAALEFMMLTGLSPHELERVQVRDAIGAGIAIGFRPDFKVKQESRRRTIPLNSRAEALWFGAATGCPPEHHPFPSVEAMQKAIRRTVGDAAQPWLRDMPFGTNDITPKMMRKWFASKVSNDQPEHVLQRLMGHAPGSPITRRHYVRSSDAQSAEAVGSIRL